jgi:hypothetical protein
MIDISKLERPEGVSPTAVPIVQWDTACCEGNLERRKVLLAQGWEPVSMQIVVKPTTVLMPGGTARKDELFVMWGFRHVRGVAWVETTTEKSGEQATA